MLSQIVITYQSKGLKSPGLDEKYSLPVTKKAATLNDRLIINVGAEGFEPPTLCL